MKDVLIVYKLENSLSQSKNQSTVKKMLIVLTLILSFAAFSCLIYYVMNTLTIIGAYYSPIQLLSFFIFIVEVALLLACLTSQYKTIYGFKDKEILAYLPIEKKNIFLGKLLYTIKSLILLSLFLTLPVFVSFGIIYKLSFVYYLKAIVAIILIPLLPFALSTFISIPFMFLLNWIKRHNWLLLISSAILISGAFYFYNTLVFNVARVFFLADNSYGNLAIEIIEIFNSNYFPSTWLSCFVVENNWIGLTKFFVPSLIIPAIAIFIGAISYKGIFNMAMILKEKALVKKSKTKKRSPFMAYFINEFRVIFRDSSYIFTYFGMAISMPIMVTFCNKMILAYAVDKMGGSMAFGTTLLVVLVFISIICSPTAAFISKEGDNFWMMRTNPNGITIPLFAKSLIGVLISFFSLILSLVLSLSFGYINFTYAAIIFLLTTIFLIGLVALGLLINLVRPSLFYSNKEHSANMIIHLSVGFLFAIIIGFLSIILIYKINFLYVVLINFAILLVFCGTIVGVLLKTFKRLYYRIEE